MAFKSIISACCAFCIMATLGVALCGCEDLGEYSDVDEYYSSFGDIVLIEGTSREQDDYSVEKYFYNEESREHFLKGEDGAYKGIKHSDYVYIAIPFESDIDMDSLALYIQSENDVAVYINVFVSDKIPSEWKAISDNETNQDTPDENADDESDKEEKVYDDPDPETRIGELAVHLESGKWSSFVLDFFNVNGSSQKTIQIKDGQYILLQIRNNSGVRVFDEEKQAYVDPQTGIELQKAEITMTNLLIRALEVKEGNEVQGG